MTSTPKAEATTPSYGDGGGGGAGVGGAGTSKTVEPFDKTDFYTILDVSKGADDDGIKRAYKIRALKTHPDKYSDPKVKEEMTERFKLVSEAFQVLSDPDKRKKYDLAQKPAATSPPPSAAKSSQPTSSSASYTRPTPPFASHRYTTPSPSFPSSSSYFNPYTTKNQRSTTGSFSSFTATGTGTGDPFPHPSSSRSGFGFGSGLGGHGHGHGHGHGVCLACSGGGRTGGHGHGHGVGVGVGVEGFDDDDDHVDDPLRPSTGFGGTRKRTTWTSASASSRPDGGEGGQDFGYSGTAGLGNGGRTRRSSSMSGGSGSRAGTSGLGYGHGATGGGRFDDFERGSGWGSRSGSGLTGSRDGDGRSRDFGNGRQRDRQPRSGSGLTSASPSYSTSEDEGDRWGGKGWSPSPAGIASSASASEFARRIFGNDVSFVDPLKLFESLCGRVQVRFEGSVTVTFPEVSQVEDGSGDRELEAIWKDDRNLMFGWKKDSERKREREGIESAFDRAFEDSTSTRVGGRVQERKGGGSGGGLGEFKWTEMKTSIDFPQGRRSSTRSRLGNLGDDIRIGPPPPSSPTPTTNADSTNGLTQTPAHSTASGAATPERSGTASEITEGGRLGRRSPFYSRLKSRGDRMGGARRSGRQDSSDAGLEEREREMDRRYQAIMGELKSLGITLPRTSQPLSFEDPVREQEEYSRAHLADELMTKAFISQRFTGGFDGSGNVMAGRERELRDGTREGERVYRGEERRWVSRDGSSSGRRKDDVWRSGDGSVSFSRSFSASYGGVDSNLPGHGVVPPSLDRSPSSFSIPGISVDPMGMMGVGSSRTRRRSSFSTPREGLGSSDLGSRPGPDPGFPGSRFGHSSLGLDAGYSMGTGTGSGGSGSRFGGLHHGRLGSVGMGSGLAAMGEYPDF